MVKTLAPLLALTFGLTLTAAYGCSSDDDDEGNSGSAGAATGGTGGAGGAGAGGAGGAGGGAGGAGGGAGGGGQTLGRIINEDAELNTFAAALVGVDFDTQALVNTPGPRTVFAPTDEAFETTLGEACVVALTDPANQQSLSELVRYHIIDGALLSSAIAEGDSTKPTFFEGASIKLTKAGASVKIDDFSNVTDADIQASNGVVHKVDQVLLPNLTGFELPAECLDGAGGAAGSGRRRP